MTQPDYKALWNSMVIDPKYLKQVQLAAQRVKQFEVRYAKVGEDTCPAKPIPWYFIGVIHYMEAGQNFNRHLHNGDPLTARTVQVPKGRPKTGQPPFTWEYSAQDALRGMGYGDPKIWDIDDVLNRLEDYNGHGYWTKGIYTPYLWSMTNHYQKGKFTADGHYNPEAISNQVGAAAILSIILNVNHEQHNNI
jgi:lysozyme family protein